MVQALLIETLNGYIPSNRPFSKLMLKMMMPVGKKKM